jgi:2-polyprenyl-3-methyl-5-hydroxy-6-metoxy-1,4-benzoquinol methylase
MDEVSNPEISLPMTNKGLALGSPADEKVVTLEAKANPQSAIATPPYRYKEFLSHIIGVYDSSVIRAYCRVRFTIININILHILALCLRGKRRVLDVGCGFGLFGCYFSALYPEITYCGIDINPKRIALANQAAARLGLRNATFLQGDARELSLSDQFDAVMMIDLLHHLQDGSKQALLTACASHLAADGRLIIKDVTTHPFHELAFTWALDVLMTRGLEMWYWNEEKFHTLLNGLFRRVDTLPITDWMPYPHVIYLCEDAKRAVS